MLKKVEREEMTVGLNVILASKKWGFLANGVISNIREYASGKVASVIIMGFAEGFNAKELIGRDEPDNTFLAIGETYQFGEGEVFMIIEDRVKSK